METTSRRLAWMNRCLAIAPSATWASSWRRRPTQRAAAECQPDGGVVNGAGDDVTAFYERGAGATVELAAVTGAREAVLKARSPSCGCHEVYDGTFSERLVPGEGVTAAGL